PLCNRHWPSTFVDASLQRSKRHYVGRGCGASGPLASTDLLEAKAVAQALAQELAALARKGRWREALGLLQDARQRAVALDMV
ncbi:unnamed protein product, partial [Polarella glacialis]